MTTPIARPARVAAGPPSAPMHAPAPAPAPAPPLLTGHDLDDPERFVTVRRVPVLDAHTDDPERGPVDVDKLRVIARNTNARVARGDFPALILGHTRPKKDADELEQPPVVGYATGWHIADYDGRPCLHCDFHYRKADHAYARSYPYRSVERLEAPDDYIDRIALLRTPPQRDLGVLHYARDDADSGSGSGQSGRRVCYARAFPPMGDADADAETNQETPMESPNGGLAGEGADAIPPASESVPDPSPNPEPEPEESDMADQATPTPTPTPNAAAEPATIGAMAPEQFVALLTEAFHSALQMAAEPEDGGGDPDQGAEHYESDEEMVPDEEDDEMDDRQNYEAAEPGAGNAFVPGAVEDERRRMYAQSGRINYAKLERRIAELEKENEVVLQELVDNRHEKRRIRYEQTLTQLEGEGYEIDRAEELAGLLPTAPEDYEASAERRIRKCYRRTPVNTRSAVAVANLDVPSGAPRGITSREQVNAVTDYAMKHGCTVAEAKAALKFA